MKHLFGMLTTAASLLAAFAAPASAMDYAQALQDAIARQAAAAFHAPLALPVTAANQCEFRPSELRVHWLVRYNLKHPLVAHAYSRAAYWRSMEASREAPLSLPQFAYEYVLRNYYLFPVFAADARGNLIFSEPPVAEHCRHQPEYAPGTWAWGARQ